MKPRAPRKPRVRKDDAAEKDGLSADVLPPPIGAGDADEKPKRKPRAPRKPKQSNDEQAAAAE